MVAIAEIDHERLIFVLNGFLQVIDLVQLQLKSMKKVPTPLLAVRVENKAMADHLLHPYVMY